MTAAVPDIPLLQAMILCRRITSVINLGSTRSRGATYLARTLSLLVHAAIALKGQIGGSESLRLLTGASLSALKCQQRAVFSVGSFGLPVV
jgi:hypothetical protein